MSSKDPVHFEHLAKLLAPHAVQDFLDDHWDQQPLHIRRNDERSDGAGFAMPFSMRDLDHVLAFSLTDEGIELLKDGASTRLSSRRQEKNSLAGFYEQYGQGHAILVREGHTRWKPVGLLANALSRELGAMVTADLFVVPPHSRDLPHSRPGVASFILQASGISTWQWAAPADNDVAAMPEVRLDAGDVLYLPRVAGHIAATADAPAVIIVLGVHVQTWEDLLVKMVNLASERNIALRKALGFGAPLGPVDEHMPGHFRDLVASVFAKPGVEPVRAALFCEQLEGMPPLPDGHFTQMRLVDHIDGESLVERRTGAVGEMRFAGEGVEFFFPGSYQSGPEKLFLAMEFMKEQPRFRVKEIPGWYSEKEKILIVRNLVRRGFLRIVTSP